MINDPTILKFEFGPEMPEEISLSIFSEIIRAIEAITTATAGLFGGGTVELFLVASPRPGSINFFFRPQINLAPAAISAVETQQKPRGKALPVIVGGATVVGTLWLVVFGQRGIVDLYKSANTSVALDHQSQNHAFVQSALANPQVIQGIVSLVKASGRSGANRVTIKLPDSEEVVVFDYASGKAKGVIGRRAQKNVSIPSQTFIRGGAPIIPLRYKGKTYSSFLAKLQPSQANSPMFAILWGSARPIPDVSQVFEARAGRIEDPEEIEPEESASNEFESAVPLLVKQTSEWK
jgi:hypothetical protein